MVDIIQLYEELGIFLKQKGNKYVACCPFHTEKTPSFFVYSDGSYHCFGCAAHGTMEQLMNIHNYDKINLWVKGIDFNSKISYIDSVVLKTSTFLRANLEDESIEKKFEIWKKYDEFLMELEFSLYENDDILSSMLDFDKKVKGLVLNEKV